MKLDLEKIREWACECHAATNHFYDEYPYSFHLSETVKWAEKFIHIISEAWRPHVLAACWCHDLIEDCRINYNGVLEMTSPECADIVYAVTNEKGKTRRERANAKYYHGIRATPYASFVKICDRLANLHYSVLRQNWGVEMYGKESDKFKSQLWRHEYQEIFDELDSLLHSAKSTKNEQ